MTTTSSAPHTGARFTDEDKEQAKQQMRKAFALLGLFTAEGRPICPICGNADKGKVKLHDNGWKCFKDVAKHGGAKYPDAIGLLMERGYSFKDAISALLDRPVGDRSLAARVAAAPDPSTLTQATFRAVVDVEVYTAIMTSPYVSLGAAQDFYATWHIDPKAVEEAGARYVTDEVSLHTDLTERFGLTRLINAGVIAPKDSDDPTAGGYFLVNRSYPVIEPHVSPTGEVVGMQFRASHATSKRVKAYPAAKEAYEHELAAWVARGKKAEDFTKRAPRYEPKFLSLRGAGPDSLVGCGLWRISRLGHPVQVYVVEGFKDLLAARTMGREAYAIPGVSGLPPERVMKYFKAKGHSLRIALDADQAGRNGTQAMLALCEAHGVRADVKDGLPEGMDVTDVLVSRRAQRGCDCATCRAWRASHPE